MSLLQKYLRETPLEIPFGNGHFLCSILKSSTQSSWIPCVLLFIDNRLLFSYVCYDRNDIWIVLLLHIVSGPMVSEISQNMNFPKTSVAKINRQSISKKPLVHYFEERGRTTWMFPVVKLHCFTYGSTFLTTCSYKNWKEKDFIVKFKIVECVLSSSVSKVFSGQLGQVLTG